MWRRRIASASVLLVVLVTLLGCEKEEDEAFEFYCLPCDQNITWSSYGDYVLGEVGDDATARRLVSHCGWTIHGGHNGGIGDTLQVASCGNEGVVFVWAFNSYHAFRLAEGWEGTTEEGVRIGDSVGVFLAAHPDFRQVNPTSYLLTDDDIEVEANFDENGGLEELIVGRFFRC